MDNFTLESIPIYLFDLINVWWNDVYITIFRRNTLNEEVKQFSSWLLIIIFSLFKLICWLLN